MQLSNPQTSRHLSTEARVTWAEADDGFHVASLAGEFFGSVDTVRGGFVSRDEYGVPIGRYATLADAKASVRSTDHPKNRRRRRVQQRVGLTTATVAGLAAVTMMVTAFASTPLS